MQQTLTHLLFGACAAALMATPAQAGWGDGHPHRRVTVSGGCNECDFAGQNLSDALIIGARFTDSDFSHATAINAGLQECLFADANLSDANLTGARMSGVAFVDTDLSDAHLTGVQGDRVRFDGSQLSGADLTGVRFVLVSFQEAQLERAVLAGSQFHHANFSEAELDRTIFRDSRLPRANFEEARGERTVFVNADLRGSNFTEAEFENADFTGARLDGAVLSGARFDRARGLTQTQLANACGDAETRLPGDLTVVPCPPPAPRAPGVMFVSRNGQRVEVMDAQRVIEVQATAVEALRRAERQLPGEIELEFRRSGDLTEMRRAVSEALDELRREEERTARMLEREEIRAERDRVAVERQEAQLAAARARLEAMEHLMRDHNIPAEAVANESGFTFVVRPDGEVVRREGPATMRWEFRMRDGEDVEFGTGTVEVPVSPESPEPAEPLPPKPGASPWPDNTPDGEPD